MRVTRHHTSLRMTFSVALLTTLIAFSAQALPPNVPGIAAPDAVRDCPSGKMPKPAWATALTQPVDTAVNKFEHWLQRPDGTLLELTVYVPTAFAGPRPTVLYATPYSSSPVQAAGNEEAEGTPIWGEGTSGYASCWTPTFLRRGYAFVIADLRGTGDSTGCYDLGGPAEQADGRAIVDWIASQPWSDGNVGMRGYSLEGLAQLATAIEAPPALKAIIPTSASDAYATARPGGIASDDALASAPFYPPLVRAGSTCSPETVAHVHGPDGHLDDWWQERWMPLHADRIEAAVLLPVGNPKDIIAGFGPVWMALEAGGVKRKGLIGPWPHVYPTIPHWHLHELRWFEHHLKGLDTGVMDEPALTLIDRDGNVTLASQFGHPLTPLLATSGVLSPNAAAGSTGYTDRPQMSRRIIEGDPTAHVRWSSAPFDQPTYLTGVPRLDVVATVDQADTNLVAMLYEVFPGGQRRYVTRGFLDGRLREGLDRPPADIPVGVPQRYTLMMWTSHHLIEEGSRLELVLSSTDACYDCPPPDAIDYFPWVVRSDLPAATVTVHEGEGQTTLWLPLDPG